MKKEDLIKLGITEEAAEKVMKIHDDEVGVLTQEKTAAETKAAGLETQLGEAAEKLKSFDGLDIDKIKQEAANWKKKHEDDTTALQKQLDAQAYDYAVEKQLSAYKFTSDIAKQGVLGALKAKEFKLEDGKLIGADEFMKTIMTENAAAFEQEDKTPPPQIMTGSGGGAAPADNATARAIMGLSTKG